MLFQVITITFGIHLFTRISSIYLLLNQHFHSISKLCIASCSNVYSLNLCFSILSYHGFDKENTIRSLKGASSRSYEWCNQLPVLANRQNNTIILSFIEARNVENTFGNKQWSLSTIITKKVDGSPSSSSSTNPNDSWLKQVNSLPFTLRYKLGIHIMDITRGYKLASFNLIMRIRLQEASVGTASRLVI